MTSVGGNEWDDILIIFNNVYEKLLNNLEGLNLNANLNFSL